MNLVKVSQSEKAVTTSMKVAEYFGKRHKNVLQTIERLDCSEQFSRLSFQPRNYRKRGKVEPYFEMNKDGFIFLVMGFRGKKAAQLKEKYIRQFNKMEKGLYQIAFERTDPQWIERRGGSKAAFKSFAETVEQFSKYATDQGSKGTAKFAYSNLTRLIDKVAGIEPETRNRCTGEVLEHLDKLEWLVANNLVKRMKEGMYCKDIFKDCISLLELFPKPDVVYLAELDGE